VAWRRGDLLVPAAATVALAAVVETARSLYERFAVDLAGLSKLERTGVALWDYRPLAPAVFAAAAAVLLPRVDEGIRALAAALCAAYAVLGLAVLGLAGWIAAAGSVGGREGLGFAFSRGDRVVTLVTQALAWVPLVLLFVLLALRASASPVGAGHGPPEPESELELEPAAGLVSDEMEALWRERLAFGPKRERARSLLGRIRELEQAGDAESARVLADEMRRL
jgi:hypothetical protein